MSTFRRFFWRGLGILLPTILTIWLLVIAYQFVDRYVAQQINDGVKLIVLEGTKWPKAEPMERDIWERRLQTQVALEGDLESYNALETQKAREAWLTRYVRQRKLNEWWDAHWYVTNFTGLVVAVILIYIVGAFLGSYLGRRVLHRLEQFLGRLPLIRKVYPAVKQVTDFFVAQDRPAMSQFSRVVAVQYPRMGLWSLGLVTGSTMRAIQDQAGKECMTVFIPSSPTPFTGYVITVPRSDAIDLNISIEEALKFTISGGVLVPPSQEIAVTTHQEVEVKSTASLPHPAD